MTKTIKVQDYLNKRREDFIQISHQIHERPESAKRRIFACELLSETLRQPGIVDVTVNVSGHETGFVARKHPLNQVQEIIGDFS